MNPVEINADHIILHLYIQPNARQDQCVGLHDNLLKIQITAPAQDNKANLHLLKWLAKVFGIAKSNVHLIQGEHSRLKVVRIDHPKIKPDWV